MFFNEQNFTTVKRFLSCQWFLFTDFSYENAVHPLYQQQFINKQKLVFDGSMVFFTDSSYEKLSDRRGSEPLVSSSSIDLRGDAMDTSSTPSKIAVSVIHITP